MAKAKFERSKDDTRFGADLIAAAREAFAHKKGKVRLSSRVIEDMPPERVKAIRAHAAAARTKAGHDR